MTLRVLGPSLFLSWEGCGIQGTGIHGVQVLIVTTSLRTMCGYTLSMGSLVPRRVPPRPPGGGTMLTMSHTRLERMISIPCVLMLVVRRRISWAGHVTFPREGGLRCSSHPDGDPARSLSGCAGCSPHGYFFSS